MPLVKNQPKRLSNHFWKRPNRSMVMKRMPSMGVYLIPDNSKMMPIRMRVGRNAGERCEKILNGHLQHSERPSIQTGHMCSNTTDASPSDIHQAKLQPTCTFAAPEQDIAIATL